MGIWEAERCWKKGRALKGNRAPLSSSAHSVKNLNVHYAVRWLARICTIFKRGEKKVQANGLNYTKIILRWSNQIIFKTEGNPWICQNISNQDNSPQTALMVTSRRRNTVSVIGTI